MDKLQRIERTCRQFYCASRYFKKPAVSLRYFASENDDGSQKLNDTTTDSQNPKVSGLKDTFNGQSKEQQIDNQERANYSVAEVELERELKQELNTAQEESKKPKLSGFAQSYERQSKALEPKNDKQDKFYTFAKLLRESKFIDLGNPEGKIVSGEIFQTVGDDLYIDFGWKFYCVCPRPVRNGKYYVRGATVRLRIKDLELSTRFIGSTTDITLSEADCTLLGLISTPLKRTENAISTQ